MSEASSNVWLAIPAALMAAACFGLTGALQHSAATSVRSRPPLRPALLLDLARRPIWLMSLLASVVGSLLQFVALSNGPLILVQPLLVTGLLFAVVIRGLIAGRQPPGHVVAGAILCGAGVAAFLVLAQPSRGTDWLTLREALPLAVGLAVVLALSLAIAARYPGRIRAATLASATGVLYGVTAGVAKLAVGLLRSSGVPALLTHWPLYAVIVLGPVGFLLNQNAFQADRTMAPALSIIIITDPLVGIGVGVLWLNERLQSGLAAITGQVLALAALALGVWLLAQAAPQVDSAVAERAQQEAEAW